MPTFEPIGIVHSPWKEKRDAPRQGVASGADGTIELFSSSGMEHAVSDLEGFERLFVIFHFHEAKHFRPKVQPPRSSVRRGVLATRSPHRPNPIGLTVVRLLGVDGLILRVGDLDIIEGTPVLDLKPYVPYADAFPNSRAGWLDEEAGIVRVATAGEANAPRDPIPAYDVTFDRDADRALTWLSSHGEDLRGDLTKALALGPAPHAYRRIRKKADHLVIAVKDFRAAFVAQGMTITVTRVFSGYSQKELASITPREAPALTLHRAFVNRSV